MINRDALIARIMEKFVGTANEVQERRRQLYAIGNESLAKLADEFGKVFPSENPYLIGAPVRKPPKAA